MAGGLVEGWQAAAVGAVVGEPATEDIVAADVEEVLGFEVFDVAVGEKDIETAVVTPTGEFAPVFEVGIDFSGCKAEFGPESLRGLGTRGKSPCVNGIGGGRHGVIPCVDKAIAEGDEIAGTGNQIAE